MRERHISVYPGLHCLSGDTDRASDTDGWQFAAIQHATDGAGGDIAQLSGGLVQIP
jgi:hypothetical protein